MADAPVRGMFRFGEFELDVPAYELRRRGRSVKLGRQPMDLLILLVERRGQLVARTEIVDRLWGKDVFVDVETGVNTAISKIRQALRDSAESPSYLETVSGKGYRFIATVEVAVTDSPALPATPTATATSAAPPAAGIASPPKAGASRAYWAAAVLLLLVVGAVLAVALRAPSRGEPAAGVAIGVLPFQNLGSDPEREYLASGLTDETSASVAQIDPDHVTVKGRTQGYKGTTKTVAEIGRELAVDYLVDGSIRAEGNRLRVTVTLIRVSDQEHVWSQFYDREPTSLLGLQQELSADIARQIRLRLSPERMTGLGRRQTQSAEAYDTYLRGRHQAHLRTAEGNGRAIELIKQAIAIDPGYALAWADLAFVYAGSTINGDAQPADVAPLAREAAEQAVRANANLSEAQLSRGYDLWLIDWDWAGALAALQLSVRLDPSNATAYRVLGHALSQAGREADAERAMQRARELDPLDGLIYALSSQVAFQHRDFAAARDFARRAIALEPGLWIGYIQLAQAYESAGEHALALEALADAERLAGGNSKILSFRGYVFAKMGRLEAAREVIRTLDAQSRERYVPPYATALVYAGLEDHPAMFAALDRAYAARDVHLIYLPVAPMWDAVRTDPRFVDLLARIRFQSQP